MRKDIKNKIGNTKLEAGELKGKIVVYKGAGRFGNVNRVGMIIGLKELKEGRIVPWEKGNYPTHLEINTLEGTTTDIPITEVQIVISAERIYSLATEESGLEITKKAFP